MRPRFAIRARKAALVLLATIILAGCTQASTTSESFGPFAPDSPFRTPIPDDAVIDPNSQAMVARISQDDALYANLIAYSIPVYHASEGTPRRTVECTRNWGACPFDNLTVPIPDDAEPSPGSDGALVVVDPATRQLFEFWQAEDHGADGWTTSWGAIADLDGDGWTVQEHSTASGASRLGGVILVSEIQQGEIPHALALQAENTCVDIFRSPATRTDGTSTRPDCIPEGALVRLDPAVDLDSLDLAPAVRMVAEAMQTYGGYIVDRGSAPLSVSFERDTTATSNRSIGTAYEDAGLRWDYDDLPGVPWDRLQVLAP